MIGIGIKGLTSVEGNKTDLKSQNTETEGEHKVFYDSV